MAYNLNNVTPAQRERVEQLLNNSGAAHQFQKELNTLLDQYAEIIPAVTSSIRNIAHGGKES